MQEQETVLREVDVMTHPVNFSVLRHSYTHEHITCDGCHSDLPEAQGNFWSNSYGQQRLSIAALIK